MIKLFRLFSPHPSTSARNLAKRKHEQSRESYRRFHDAMAAKAGVVIPWAKP